MEGRAPSPGCSHDESETNATEPRFMILTDHDRPAGSEHPTNPRRPLFPLVFLLTCYAIFDSVAPAVLFGLLEQIDFGVAVLLYVTILSCVLAQLGVLAAWGVLGTARPIARWSSGLLAAALLGALLTSETFDETSPSKWRERFEVLQALPLAYVGVQAPIWALSLGLGFRIIAAGTTAQTPQRFTLRGLFFATAVVATALGLLQAGAWAGSRDDAFSAIAFCALGGPAWGLLAVTPCLLFALGTNSPVRGAAYLLAYVGALALALRGVHLASGGTDPLFELLSGFAAICGPTAFTLFGSFLVLRHYGYSLRRIPPEPPGPSA